MNQIFSFDRAVLRELLAELGEECAAEVLQIFLADTATKLTILEANVHDRSLLKREAHSIKSSAATFGFSDLSELARHLESVASSLTAEEAQNAVCGLGRRFETVRQFAEAKLCGTGLQNEAYAVDG